MGALQAPAVLHAITALPAHLAVPGVHTPVQAPDAQAWLVQATAVPHDPVVVQVCTPLPEHLDAPGMHTPAQAPIEHA